ncbi:hypothetical protein Tco_0427366 [Tanacetum coccineum]
MEAVVVVAFEVVMGSRYHDWDVVEQDEVEYKRRCCSLIPTKLNSLPHAHAQTTKTYYWHQDSRIKKAQVHTKTKTFANSDIQDLPLRPQVYQGRLLASFQDDAKYERVGQETRSQDDKDDQGKELKFSEIKTKFVRQRQRLKIKDHTT